MSDQPPTPGAPPPSNTMGIVGLVLGCCSFATCGLLAPLGIVFSGIGMRREPRGLAIAGLIISIFSLSQIGILVAIMVSSFLRAREISRGNACQENLSRIDGAKQQWALEKYMDENAAPTWGDLVGPSAYIRQTPMCRRAKPIRSTRSERRRLAAIPTRTRFLMISRVRGTDPSSPRSPGI